MLYEIASCCHTDSHHPQQRHLNRPNMILCFPVGHWATLAPMLTCLGISIRLPGLGLFPWVQLPRVQLNGVCIHHNWSHSAHSGICLCLIEDLFLWLATEHCTASHYGADYFLSCWHTYSECLLHTIQGADTCPRKLKPEQVTRCRLQFIVYGWRFQRSLSRAARKRSIDGKWDFQINKTFYRRCLLSSKQRWLFWLDKRKFAAENWKFGGILTKSWNGQWKKFHVLTSCESKEVRIPSHGEFQ